MGRFRFFAVGVGIAFTAGVVWCAPALAIADSAATGTISTVPGASHVDGELFYVDDGVNGPTSFEFDSNGVVTPGAVAVEFPGTTASQMKNLIITRINSVGAGLQVSASDAGFALVGLVNDNPGPLGNVPLFENVANAGFTVTGMSGGAANSAPVLATIGNRAIDEGAQIQFGVSATDPNNDSLAYTASNLPSGASFDPVSRIFTWTPGFNQAGSYPNVRFGVSDGTAEDSEEITLTVANVNRPPALAAIGGRSVGEGAQLQFSVSATDPDGGPLTYSVSNLPAGASFDQATATFAWTPAFDQAGSYPNVRFEVSDGTATDSEDVTISVGDVSQAPLTTATTLSVKQTKRKLKVSGTVEPNRAGDDVEVTLLRKKGGQFRRLFTDRPTLSPESEYRTRFQRPDGGRCRIEASFSGNDEFEPSSAVETFRC